MQNMLLLILDGWGYSTEKTGNAILNARTPNFDNLWQHYPHTLLDASGLAVGLPPGQMGNSEVGHLHIGAGRLAPQDLTRINLAISGGEFFKNSILNTTIDDIIKSNASLHIFGLLSDGGVHSHTDQIAAMLELAAKRGLRKIYLHAFLDGRDTPPKSAQTYISKIQKLLQDLGCGQIASLCGRFYAMDRDKRWERVNQAYDMLTQGKCEFYAESALAGLELAYARGETDEFVKPTLIAQPIKIQNNDAVIFMNFRADRGRELTEAFTNPDFSGFTRKTLPKLAHYVTLTQYAADLKVEIAFPPIELHNVLGEVVANHGLTQLRIAETEKYAHVTYFLNGGEEKIFPHEDRILIPSPKVATYDLKPEMSLYEVTTQLITAINSQKYNFIACNFANPDMLGHTGNFAATVTAIEAVDKCLGEVIVALQKNGGEAIITADHGNAEKMLDPKTHQPHTAHTCAPVPFIYVGRKAEMAVTHGKLVDLAPTILYLIAIEKPQEMTGQILVKTI
jgi:2,3-bisphosphoglycerate-independent phosphoglycerate mutase